MVDCVRWTVAGSLSSCLFPDPADSPARSSRRDPSGVSGVEGELWWYWGGLYAHNTR